MAIRSLALIVIAASATVLGGCVTTSMQGYADLQPPPHQIQHIAAIAPPALITALAKEASKRGVTLEDANVVLPPTRQYNETEIRQAMTAHGIDGVLVVNVTGDTGIQQQYAGTIANTSYSGSTIANTSYSGTSSGSATVMGNMIYGSGMSSGMATTTGTTSGRATSTSTPIYRYSRAIGFEARLSDPQTSRKFWVGSGQTKSGGSLFIAAASIFNDLQTKGLIGANQAMKPARVPDGKFA